MATRQELRLSKKGGRIQREVVTVPLTPTEQSDYDARSQAHETNVQAKLAERIGKTEEQIRRVNIRRKILAGFQEKDQEVLAALRPYFVSIKAANPSLTRNQILQQAGQALADDIYEERFG